MVEKEEEKEELEDRKKYVDEIEEKLRKIQKNIDVSSTSGSDDASCLMVLNPRKFILNYSDQIC